MHFPFYIEGDSLREYGYKRYKINGMQFSTLDNVNDLAGPSAEDCVAKHHGGWWYRNCHHVYLNGRWNSLEWEKPWKPKVDDGTQVRATLMMIKALK
jgi:hypothetical protein